MSADLSAAEDQGGGLPDIRREVGALAAHPPGELARLLTEPGLGAADRQAVEAAAVLVILDDPQAAPGLLPLLRTGSGGARSVAEDAFAGRLAAHFKQAGAVRKVSVSLPESLTAAVQRRVGRGKFSQYVTEAVARQFELDLLTDLSSLLAEEYGPVAEEYLVEARAAWPEGE